MESTKLKYNPKLGWILDKAIIKKYCDCCDEELTLPFYFCVETNSFFCPYCETKGVANCRLKELYNGHTHFFISNIEDLETQENKQKDLF